MDMELFRFGFMLGVVTASVLLFGFRLGVRLARADLRALGGWWRRVVLLLRPMRLHAM